MSEADRKIREMIFSSFNRLRMLLSSIVRKEKRKLWARFAKFGTLILPSSESHSIFWPSVGLKHIACVLNTRICLGRFGRRRQLNRHKKHHWVGWTKGLPREWPKDCVKVSTLMNAIHIQPNNCLPWTLGTLKMWSSSPLPAEQHRQFRRTLFEKMSRPMTPDHNPYFFPSESIPTSASFEWSESWDHNVMMSPHNITKQALTDQSNNRGLSPEHHHIFSILEPSSVQWISRIPLTGSRHIVSKWQTDEINKRFSFPRYIIFLTAKM
jgi:hypothetical protein